VANPVVLVHGFASSFQHGWAEDGWPDLLADEGREVIGHDLPGHGHADKPPETSAYDAMEATVLAGFGDHAQVDAIGFSLGARILLTIASDHPERFGRLVVMGVGANLFRNEANNALADAVELGAPPDQIGLRVFEKMAADPRNDRGCHRRWTPTGWAGCPARCW
jgi:pimeloyl-ACP methyl ester carboxylesterase